MAPGIGLSMRVEVHTGASLVITLDDGWSYPLEFSRADALHLASMLVQATLDAEVQP